MAIGLSALVPLLIDSGPTLIRGIGSLFGSDGEKAANTAASLVESVGKLKDPKAAEAELAYQLGQIPPEQQVALEGMKVQLEQIKAEREKNRQDFEASLHRETQATIRNGDQGGNDYVKETRPKIARYSAYAAIAYAFLFQLFATFDKGSGVDWTILGALYGPALTYMGMRTVDAFSKFKTGKQ